MIEERVGEEGKEVSETMSCIEEGHLVFLDGERSWDLGAEAPQDRQVDLLKPLIIVAHDIVDLQRVLCPCRESQITQVADFTNFAKEVSLG
jgi:hypothetical protein